MDLQNEKCVLVIDEALPLGIIANTAGILGVTLGKHIPDSVGPDVADADGNPHLGIIQIPVPVLKADGETLRALREQLYRPEFAGLTVVDFSDVAQSCNIYEEFIAKAAGVAERDYRYFGLGVCGPKKLVNRLTGSMPLLR